MQPRTPNPSGFTLIEMLIVVAILGLLAAVAIPQFTGTRDQGKTAAMASSLSILRTAIDSYWNQHDAFPGQDGAADFAEQLLKTSNKAGDTGTGANFSFGPYLHNGSLPVNPLSDTSSIRVVPSMPGAPTGPEAWIYNPTTGEIRCNFAGSGVDGVKYYSY